jgi:YHS domain-containing protein
MKTYLFWLFALPLLALQTRGLAQHNPAKTPDVFAHNGVAIRGYDPVAYFTDGKPTLGDSTLRASYDGATWYFATAAHRDAFQADPAKYAPQFGGYCAYGMSDEAGHKAPTQPDAWTIVDDKLYLNYNTKVRGLWSKDKQSRIEQANQNWPTVKRTQ